MTRREVAVARLVLDQLSRRPPPAVEHAAPWFSARPDVLDAVDPFVALSVPPPQAHHTDGEPPSDEPRSNGRARRGGRAWSERAGARTTRGADLRAAADGGPPPDGGPGARAAVGRSTGRERLAAVGTAQAGRPRTAARLVAALPADAPATDGPSGAAAHAPATGTGPSTAARRPSAATGDTADMTNPAGTATGQWADGAAASTADSAAGSRRITTGFPDNRTAAVARIAELAEVLLFAPGGTSGSAHTRPATARRYAVPPGADVLGRPATWGARMPAPVRPMREPGHRAPADRLTRLADRSTAADPRARASTSEPAGGDHDRTRASTSEPAGGDLRDERTTGTTLPGPWTRPVRQMVTGVRPAGVAADSTAAGGPAIDAEAVAEAVAEVLAAQARRNGVDVPDGIDVP